jgi:hypothetical protein
VEFSLGCARLIVRLISKKTPYYRSVESVSMSPAPDWPSSWSESDATAMSGSPPSFASGIPAQASPLFLRLMRAVPFQHRGIPLSDPRSLSACYALLPALGLFVLQRHIATVPIEPLLSAISFLWQISAARFPRWAFRHRPGI